MGSAAEERRVTRLQACAAAQGAWRSSTTHATPPLTVPHPQHSAPPCRIHVRLLPCPLPPTQSSSSALGRGCPLNRPVHTCRLPRASTPWQLSPASACVSTSTAPRPAPAPLPAVGPRRPHPAPLPPYPQQLLVQRLLGGVRRGVDACEVAAVLGLVALAGGQHLGPAGRAGTWWACW